MGDDQGCEGEEVEVVFSRSICLSDSLAEEEKFVGNRDARGREKRKPKKKEIKQTSRPARPVAEYKRFGSGNARATYTAPVKIP